MIVLGADIGATNTNLSIVGFKGTKPEILLLKRESTSSVNRFCDLVNRFLVYARRHRFEPKDACFAVAGPVEEQGENRRVRMTNVRLVVDAKDLAMNTPLEDILIINDFVAISHATNLLNPSDSFSLNRGKRLKGKVRVTIGAGTGLGKNILYYNESLNTYMPIPSEGGHSDLPLLSKEELELSDFIRRRRHIRNQIVYEDVLSGRGLESIYQYLRTTRFLDSPKDLSAEEISKTKKNNPCSRETFEWFVRFYARCARNFVLDAFAIGGLYIAGGIAAKNTDSFSHFLAEFVRNEEYHSLLKKIPVDIITNYDISTVGAAYAFIIQKALEFGGLEKWKRKRMKAAVQ